MSKYLEESYNEALKENLALIEQNKMLLAKLEIAEKALEKIAKNGKTDVDGEDAENMLIMCGDIADEALKQIRE